MRQNTPIWRFAPTVRQFSIVVPLVALCLGGCTTATQAPFLEYSLSAHTSLRADTNDAFNACIATCMENTSLALVTRTGCIEGCENARSTFPMTDRTYSSQQDCLDALLGQNMVMDSRITAMHRTCDEKWTHVHNRKGCYIAAEAFHAALTPRSVCGETVVSPAPSPSAPLPPAREKTPPTPIQPNPSLASMEKQPQPTAAATPTPAPSANTPGHLPEIHDTPKYQKSAHQKPTTLPTDNKGSGASSQAAPEINPTPPAVPEYAKKIPEPTPAPAKSHQAEADTSSPTTVSKTPTSVVTPPTTTPVAPSSEPAAAAPVAVTQPAPVAPLPVPTQDGKTNPPAVAAPTPPVTPPSTSLPADVAEPSPAKSTESAIPAPSILASGTERPLTEPSSEPKFEIVPLPDPDTPSPMPEARTESVLGKDPRPTTAPVRKGPPIPGQNADRPIPQQPQQVEQTVTKIAPPIPSMLDRPYTTPTIIAPQINIPPETLGSEK